MKDKKDIETDGKSPNNMSRRERQIMDIIYKRGRATANDVVDELHDPPSNSAVRATLRMLEEKGHLRHEEENLRYVYLPTVPRDKARKSAVKRLLETFFDNSVEHSVAAILDQAKPQLSRAELDRIAQLIDKAKKEGR
jgi:predicted transcriptional regulator